jgi:aspartyl-tRNA(Asn)/glutamyl-tRNA(Gln) amidotransferase subunit C
MITQSELEKVAKLARVGLTQEESSSLTSDMEKIISYFEQLKKLNLQKVLPMTHAVSIVLEPRPDQLVITKNTTALMPYQKHNHFCVPVVLE